MTNEPKFLEVLYKYFDEELGTPSLKKFFLSNKRYVIENSNFKHITATWNARFNQAAADRAIEISNEQPDWIHILEQVLEQRSEDKKKKAQSSSGSHTTISSESNLLTDLQKASFEEKYKSLVRADMWEIEDGVFVEEKMYEYGMAISYEHAAHSFILNIGDPCWETVFTESQLYHIKTQFSKPLPTLEPAIKDFFKKFKNLKDIDDIWKIADEAHFHPIKEFDLDYAKRMILDVISSYRWGNIYRTAVGGGERDLIMLIWRAIDMCFQNLQIDSLRSDQQSVAGSARTNENRMGSDGGIRRKVQAYKPDLILKKEHLEYGASENGYGDEVGVGSKEICEKYLKLPKTLKDMALLLAADMGNEEKKIRKIQVIGIINTHLRMNSMVLDMPAGYVCRVTPLIEQRIGATLGEPFYKTYLPFLEQVIRLKDLVKSTIDVVSGFHDESDSDSDSEDRTGYLPSIRSSKTIKIPSALNTTTTTTSKKRKSNNL